MLGLGGRTVPDSSQVTEIAAVSAGTSNTVEPPKSQIFAFNAVPMPSISGSARNHLNVKFSDSQPGYSELPKI